MYCIKKSYSMVNFVFLWIVSSLTVQYFMVFKVMDNVNLFPTKTALTFISHTLYKRLHNFFLAHVLWNFPHKGVSAKFKKFPSWTWEFFKTSWLTCYGIGHTKNKIHENIIFLQCHIVTIRPPILIFSSQCQIMQVLSPYFSQCHIMHTLTPWQCQIMRP